MLNGSFSVQTEMWVKIFRLFQIKILPLFDIEDFGEKDIKKSPKKREIQRKTKQIPSHQSLATL